MLLPVATGRSWVPACLRSGPVLLAACRALLHTGSGGAQSSSGSSSSCCSRRQLAHQGIAPVDAASQQQPPWPPRSSSAGRQAPASGLLRRMRPAHTFLPPAALHPSQQQQQSGLPRAFTAGSAACWAAAPSSATGSPGEPKPAAGEQGAPAADQAEQQSAAGAAESFINTTAAAAKAAAAAAGAGTSGPAAAAAASAGGVLAGVVVAPTAEYTMRQVSKHASDETCWIVVNGKVYDVTSYIDDHPGGAESILLNAGVDCTEEFMGVHSQEAKELLERFVIGRVKQGKGAAAKVPQQPAAVTAADAAAAAAADPSRPLVTLADPQARYALPLAEKRRLNHDTFFMRFALPSPQFRIGLPCGKHVFLCADIGGEPIVRAYTPVSGDRDLGVLDFLIKVYWPNTHPAFPAGGKMTNHLAAMKEGDVIHVKGPYGKFTYEGGGRYNLNRVSGHARYLSMVAGGSGVTPCYSVIKEVLQDPSDPTRCALIYANKHQEDIWLWEELDDMARRNPDRLHVWYVLEEPGAPPAPFDPTSNTRGSTSSSSGSSGDSGSLTAAAAGVGASVAPWTFSTGFITPDMMAQHLLPARPPVLVTAAGSSASGSGDATSSTSSGGSLALMCGPPGMLEGVVVPGLAAMGFSPEQMVVF